MLRAQWMVASLNVGGFERGLVLYRQLSDSPVGPHTLEASPAVGARSGKTSQHPTVGLRTIYEPCGNAEQSEKERQRAVASKLRLERTEGEGGESGEGAFDFDEEGADDAVEFGFSHRR